MVETSAFHTLKSLCQKYPVVLLSGPVGCGLESMARRLMPSKNYIDLENPQTLRLAKESPRTFLMAFPDGVIIHAIDKLPQMIDAVVYHVGKWGFTPGKYIATTTTNLDFQDPDNRIATCNVLGLTVEDLSRSNAPIANPFQIILSGQLPSEPDTVTKMILEKNIRTHINVSNLSLFLSFMKACATESGEMFSVNSLAKKTGVSAPTAKTWLSVLQKNFIIRTISDKGGGKIFYFCDSGLLCSLLGITKKEDLILSLHKDRIVRTFAVNELLRGRFAKALESNLNLGSDCDFEASWKEGYSLFIEPNIEVTEFCTKKAKHASNGSKTLILYLGDVTYSRDGIDCIGYRDWAKLAMQLDYFS